MNPTRLVVEALRLDRAPLADLRRRGAAAVERGAGGFVLFGGEAREAASLIGRLQEAADRPLWFAADLERGAGQQFSGLEDLPPPAALAHHPEPERAARTAGRLTARQARSVGVNWILAPVLDLDVEPENPIVGTRSFGGDPRRVAALGRAWIEACQSEGVAACMKHFPGHGRTTTDSHVELPVVEAGRDALEDDLRPFRAAAPVAATAMIAHVAYPALAEGRRRPATLEPAVARQLLREEVGFRGPAATDALTMAGFAAPAGGGTGGGTAGGSDGGAPEGAGAGAGGAVAAVRAGCDLLLYPGDGPAVARALGRAARRCNRFGSRLREAIRRSRGALERVDGPAPEGATADGQGGAGPAPDAAELDRLARRCVVAAGPGPGAVLGAAGGLTVRVVDEDGTERDALGSRSGDGDRFGSAFVEALAAEGVEVVTGDDGGSSLMGPGRRTTGPGSGESPAGTLLLVRSTPRAWKGRTGLGEEARRDAASILDGEGRDSVYPVVFGHRRLLDGLGGVGACAWWGRPRAERAAARWLASRLRG